MPKKHYSSKPTSLRYHLWPNISWKSARNWGPRQEICHHVL